MSTDAKDNPQAHHWLIPTQFKPGQSGNPGGFPGSVRGDVAFKKLMAMTPDELINFVPKTGAEILAMQQFKRACVDNIKFKTLPYAKEILDRTDGPVVRKVEKRDVTMLEAERQRFEAAIDALVEKRGCSRGDAALVLATINPSYKKFCIEPDTETE